MRTITTKSGFTCMVDEGRIDDMRFFDALVDMEAPESTPFDKLRATKNVMTILLGEEQKQALYKHIEEEHGTAKTAVVASELQDIIAGLSDSKKK